MRINRSEMVSDWFNLRTFLHSFHFIHVTMSLIIFDHLSIWHIEHCRYDRTSVTHKNLVYNLAHHESSIVQWLECPTSILEGNGYDPVILAKLTSHFPPIRPEHHWLTNTIHLILKMTSSQVVEMSVTNNNSSFQNYPHPDNHTIWTTNTTN